jgi:hypothetical protein
VNKLLATFDSWPEVPVICPADRWPTQVVGVDKRGSRRIANSSLKRLWTSSPLLGSNGDGRP